MPRETLRALDADVARLLLAGGSVARTDEALAARRDALAAFAAKVPALGKVAEQIARVLGGAAGGGVAPRPPPREATAELLNLMVMARQVRGAQAAPARPEGALASVPAFEPVDTPLAASEIEPVFRALTGRGAERLRAVEQAIERGAVRDLRLLRLWVAALDDSTIADVVAQRAIPVLGAAAVPLLRAAFDPQGGATDARRLRCLHALLPREEASALLGTCIEHGAVPVRVAALSLLAAQDPSAAEPLAERMLAADRSAEARAAAADALAGRASTRGLELLVAALGDADVVRRAARVALATYAHPETVARVLALLTPEALDIRDYEPPRLKKGQTLTNKQQQAADKERAEQEARTEKQLGLLRAVIAVLGRRAGDEAARARLLALWSKHARADVRAAAGRALLESGRADVLASLASAMGSQEHALREVARAAAVRRVVTQPDIAGSHAALAPYFEPATLKKAGTQPASAALSALLLDASPATDRAWADTCLAVLGNPRLCDGAVRVLVAMNDVRAVGPLLDALPKAPAAAVGLFAGALAHFGDARAVAPLAALLDRKDAAAVPRYWVCDALRRFGDPSALPALTDRAARLEKVVTAAAKKAAAAPQDDDASAAGKGAGGKKAAKKNPAPADDYEARQKARTARIAVQNAAREMALLRPVIDALRAATTTTTTNPGA